jgi:hypothetical protein
MTFLLILFRYAILNKKYCGHKFIWKKNKVFNTSKTKQKQNRAFILSQMDILKLLEKEIIIVQTNHHQ